LDESKTWLYVVDHANDRVIRININTGTVGTTPQMPQTEVVEEYSTITDYTWETVVNSGLEKPCGIIVKGNKMFVSDYARNEIIVYDITSMPAVELNRIETPAQGIMGIALAPDGKICYVDHIANEVVKITPAESTVGVSVINNLNWKISPNPSNGELGIYPVPSAETSVELMDATGKLISKSSYDDLRNITNQLSSGIYFIRINENGTPMKWVIQN
jgi:DNA-binding beta-propeller fold protein YncE